MDKFVYNEDDRRNVLDLNYANIKLNIKLDTLYGSKKNAEEMLDRVSRQFYDYVYDTKTYPEDFKIKEYILLHDEDVLEISAKIMLSHLESVVLTRRDLLVLETGVTDNNELMDDWNKNMEAYQFSTATRRIFNQNRYLRYKERLNNYPLDSSLIRVGY